MLSKGMQLEDARRLNQQAQAALRKRAVRLVLSGHGHAEVAGIIGVARGTVSRWMSAYKQQGEKTFASGLRGRPVGKGRALTEKEERTVQDWIRDKQPEQLKLPFMLWTARAVRDLIHCYFGKTLTIRGVQIYLERWGFTPQKPVFRAKERCNAAITRWLNETYPAIQARAKAEGAVIQWGDETGISNQDQIGRSYAPQGETPVFKRLNKRLTLSMISSISNRGDLQFMIYEETLNAALFLKFLKRLIAGARRKIFLIVDNLKVHKAKIVQAWLEKEDIKQRIEIFYLPSYAPDLNPDELLNNDLKQQLNNQPRPNDKIQLVRTVRIVLRSIQKQPQRVIRYFRHPAIRYAAA
jgi:transposase